MAGTLRRSVAAVATCRSGRQGGQGWAVRGGRVLLPGSSSSCRTRCTTPPRDLKVELAGRLRDEVNELKKEMRGMDAAGVR